MAAERSRQHVANATADAIHLLNDEQLRVFDGGGGGGGSGGGGGATAAQLRDDSLSPKVEGARDVEGTQTFGELHVDAVEPKDLARLIGGVIRDLEAARVVEDHTWACPGEPLKGHIAEGAEEAGERLVHFVPFQR